MGTCTSKPTSSQPQSQVNTRAAKKPSVSRSSTLKEKQSNVLSPRVGSATNANDAFLNVDERLSVSYGSHHIRVDSMKEYSEAFTYFANDDYTDSEDVDEHSFDLEDGDGVEYGDQKSNRCGWSSPCASAKEKKTKTASCCTLPSKTNSGPTSSSRDGPDEPAVMSIPLFDELDQRSLKAINNIFCRVNYTVGQPILPPPRKRVVKNNGVSSMASLPTAIAGATTSCVATAPTTTTATVTAAPDAAISTSSSPNDAVSASAAGHAPVDGSCEGAEVPEESLADSASVVTVGAGMSTISRTSTGTSTGTGTGAGVSVAVMRPVSSPTNTTHTNTHQHSYATGYTSDSEISISRNSFSRSRMSHSRIPEDDVYNYAENAFSDEPEQNFLHVIVRGRVALYVHTPHAASHPDAPGNMVGSGFGEGIPNVPSYCVGCATCAAVMAPELPVTTTNASQMNDSPHLLTTGTLSPISTPNSAAAAGRDVRGGGRVGGRALSVIAESKDEPEERLGSATASPMSMPSPASQASALAPTAAAAPALAEGGNAVSDNSDAGAADVDVGAAAAGAGVIADAGEAAHAPAVDMVECVSADTAALAAHADEEASAGMHTDTCPSPFMADPVPLTGLSASAVPSVNIDACTMHNADNILEPLDIASSPSVGSTGSGISQKPGFSPLPVENAQFLRSSSEAAEAEVVQPHIPFPPPPCHLYVCEYRAGEIFVTEPFPNSCSSRTSSLSGAHGAHQDGQGAVQSHTVVVALEPVTVLSIPLAHLSSSLSPHPKLRLALSLPLQSLSSSHMTISLASIPFFADLPPHKLSLLARLFTVRKTAANKVLFREGQRSTGLYYLASGRCEATAEGADGKPIFLYTVTSGQWFGETALVGVDVNPNTQTRDDTSGSGSVRVGSREGLTRSRSANAITSSRGSCGGGRSGAVAAEVELGDLGSRGCVRDKDGERQREKGPRSTHPLPRACTITSISDSVFLFLPRRRLRRFFAIAPELLANPEIPAHEMSNELEDDVASLASDVDVTDDATGTASGMEHRHPSNNSGYLSGPSSPLFHPHDPRLKRTQPLVTPAGGADSLSPLMNEGAVTVGQRGEERQRVFTYNRGVTVGAGSGSVPSTGDGVVPGHTRARSNTTPLLLSPRTTTTGTPRGTAACTNVPSSLSEFSDRNRKNTPTTLNSGSGFSTGFSSLLAFRGGSILKAIPLFASLQRKAVGPLAMYDEHRLTQLADLMQWVHVPVGGRCIVRREEGIESEEKSDRGDRKTEKERQKKDKDASASTTAQGTDADAVEAVTKVYEPSFFIVVRGNAQVTGPACFLADQNSSARKEGSLDKHSGDSTASGTDKAEKPSSSVDKGVAVDATPDTITSLFDIVNVTIEKSRGEYVGEWLLVDPSLLSGMGMQVDMAGTDASKTSLTIEATTDLLMLRLPSSSFAQFMKVCPEIGASLRDHVVNTSVKRTLALLQASRLVREHVYENRAWSKMDGISMLFRVLRVRKGEVVCRQGESVRKTGVGVRREVDRSSEGEDTDESERGCVYLVVRGNIDLTMSVVDYGGNNSTAASVASTTSTSTAAPMATSVSAAVDTGKGQLRPKPRKPLVLAASVDTDAEATTTICASSGAVSAATSTLPRVEALVECLQADGVFGCIDTLPLTTATATTDTTLLCLPASHFAPLSQLCGELWREMLAHLHRRDAAVCLQMPLFRHVRENRAWAKRDLAASLWHSRHVEKGEVIIGKELLVQNVENTPENDIPSDMTTSSTSHGRTRTGMNANIRTGADVSTTDEAIWLVVHGSVSVRRVQGQGCTSGYGYGYGESRYGESVHARVCTCAKEEEEEEEAKEKDEESLAEGEREVAHKGEESIDVAVDVDTTTDTSATAAATAAVDSSMGARAVSIAPALATRKCSGQCTGWKNHVASFAATHAVAHNGGSHQSSPSVAYECTITQPLLLGEDRALTALARALETAALSHAQTRGPRATPLGGPTTAGGVSAGGAKGGDGAMLGGGDVLSMRPSLFQGAFRPSTFTAYKSLPSHSTHTQPHVNVSTMTQTSLNTNTNANASTSDMSTATSTTTSSSTVDGAVADHAGAEVGSAAVPRDDDLITLKQFIAEGAITTQENTPEKQNSQFCPPHPAITPANAALALQLPYTVTALTACTCLVLPGVDALVRMINTAPELTQVLFQSVAMKMQHLEENTEAKEKGQEHVQEKGNEQAAKAATTTVDKLSSGVAPVSEDAVISRLVRGMVDATYCDLPALRRVLCGDGDRHTNASFGVGVGGVKRCETGEGKKRASVEKDNAAGVANNCDVKRDDANDNVENTSIGGDHQGRGSGSGKRVVITNPYTNYTFAPGQQ